jgi:cell filamentation protein
MLDKNGNDIDPDFWPGTSVMRNRLGICESERLTQAEQEYTALRAATLALGPACRGLPHLCAIHRHLFQDLFDWAGEVRTVDICDGDICFCHFDYIEKEGNALMQALEEENWLTRLDKAEFVARLAHYYCEINMLHPFRFGSGRAQRIFFEQLALHAGYSLDWRNIDREAWRAANQAGATGELAPLKAIFNEAVNEAEENA